MACSDHQETPTRQPPGAAIKVVGGMIVVDNVSGAIRIADVGVVA